MIFLNCLNNKCFNADSQEEAEKIVRETLDTIISEDPKYGQ